MSSAANWSYTAIATYWKQLGIADNGDPLGYAPPVQILCDYGGDATARLGSIGVEINIKNTFWTEFTGAEKGDKYISSQTAPSGASRSFRYQSFTDRWNGSLSLLRGLDKHGCAAAITPPNPNNAAFAGIWIGKGGCMCGSK